LHGHPLKYALERVGRCSHRWNVAVANQGGIQLQTPGVRNPVYEQQALREFQLALENGDILVQVEGRTVPAEFWRSQWSFEFDAERLLSFKNNVTTVEGVAPHLVVPQAPEGLDLPVLAKSLSDTAQPSEKAAETSEPLHDHKSPEQIIREYVREREQEGLTSNIDEASRRVLAEHPKYGRERCRQLYRDVTGRSVDDRGRSGKRARASSDLVRKTERNPTDKT